MTKKMNRSKNSAFKQRGTNFLTIAFIIILMGNGYGLTNTSASVPDLLLHYDFGYDSAIDRSSNSNRGTPVGGVGSTSDPAPTSQDFYGESFLFDGINDYVDANNPTYIKNLNVGTISAWVKTTDTNAVVFSSGSTASNYYYFMLFVWGSQMAFYVYGNGYSCLTGGGSSVSNGQWQNLIWTSDGTQWQMFQNGNLVQTVTTSTCNAAGTWFNDYSTNNFAVGALHRPSMYGYMNGKIDELQIFDAPVTDQQASDIYNGIALSEPQPWQNHGFDEYTQSISGMQIDEINSDRIASSYDGSGSNWESSSISKPIDIDFNPIVEVNYSFSYPSNYYMGSERLMFFDSNGAYALWAGHHDAWAGSTGRYYIYGYNNGAALSSSGYTSVYSQNYLSSGTIRVVFSNINHVLNTVDAHVEIDKAGGGAYIQDMIGISIPTKVRLFFQYHDSYWSSSQVQKFENYIETDWGFEEGQIGWMAAPTNSEYSYSSSWDFKSSNRVNQAYGSNYFNGVSVGDKLWVDEQIPNVLEFDKLSTNVGYVEMANIDFNSYDNFSISVDYKSSYLGILGYTPAFYLNFAGGGYAFIQDVSGDGAIHNIGGTQDIVYGSIRDSQTYRLELKVSQNDGIRNVKLRYFDLSSLETPATNNDINWVTLASKTYGISDYSFTGPVTVRLGTMQDINHNDLGIPEKYEFTNFGVTTGIVESSEFAVQLFDIPNDIETDPSRYEVISICGPAIDIDFDVGTCEASVNPGDGVQIKIKEYDNFGYETEAFEIYLSDGLGDIPRAAGIWGWSYESLSIKRFEAYRPWLTLRSSLWYDSTLRYSQVEGIENSVTETRTHEVGVSLKVNGFEQSIDGAVAHTTSDTFSNTFSMTSQNIKARDGAIASIYVKHHFYRIEGIYKLMCYGCGINTPDVELKRFDIDSIILKDIEITNRKIVHTAIDIPQITGYANSHPEVQASTNAYLSNPGPISIPIDLKETSENTISNSLTISKSFGAKFELKGLTIGMTEGFKYTYSQSISAFFSTSMMYIVDIYPINYPGAGERTFTFYKVNSFELLIIVT